MKSYLNDEEKKKYEGDPSGERPDPGQEPPEQEPRHSALDYEMPEKTSVVEQFRVCLTTPKKLIGLSELSVGRFVRYSLLLGLLVTVMTYVIPVVATLIHVGGLHDLFENRMPDFSVQGGRLTIAEPFRIGLGSCDIVIDSTSGMVAEDSLGSAELTFAIGAQKVQALVKTSGMRQVLVEGKVSEYFEDGFNRQTLIAAIPGFYIAIILGGVFSLIFTLVRYLLASLIYMILAWAIARNTGLGLNKGNVFRLCFYAQTIGILLVNLNSATGAYLPGTIVSMVGIFITLTFIFKTFSPYMRYGQDE